MPLPICPAPTTPTLRISIFTSAGCPASSIAPLFQLRLERRHRLEEVRDQADIGDLEDRRLLVLVDGHDDLRVLHSGQMLDRAGDADGDIELGRHDLAGLADL